MLTVAEVASALGVTGRTVRNEIERGHLHAHRIAGVYRIPLASLRSYLFASGRRDVAETHSADGVDRS